MRFIIIFLIRALTASWGGGGGGGGGGGARARPPSPPPSLVRHCNEVYNEGHETFCSNKGP